MTEAGGYNIYPTLSLFLLFGAFLVCFPYNYPVFIFRLPFTHVLGGRGRIRKQTGAISSLPRPDFRHLGHFCLISLINHQLPSPISRPHVWEVCGSFRILTEDIFIRPSPCFFHVGQFVSVFSFLHFHLPASAPTCVRCLRKLTVDDAS